jgi:hypothetical protein
LPRPKKGARKFVNVPATPSEEAQIMGTFYVDDVDKAIVGLEQFNKHSEIIIKVEFYKDTTDEDAGEIYVFVTDKEDIKDVEDELDSLGLLSERPAN